MPNAGQPPPIVVPGIITPCCPKNPVPPVLGLTFQVNYFTKLCPGVSIPTYPDPVPLTYRGQNQWTATQSGYFYQLACVGGEWTFEVCCAAFFLPGGKPNCMTYPTEGFEVATLVCNPFKYVVTVDPKGPPGLRVPLPGCCKEEITTQVVGFSIVPLPSV